MTSSPQKGWSQESRSGLKEEKEQRESDMDKRGQWVMNIIKYTFIQP